MVSHASLQDFAGGKKTTERHKELGGRMEKAEMKETGRHEHRQSERGRMERGRDKSKIPRVRKAGGMQMEAKRL